jgi:hypothetical protein
LHPHLIDYLADVILRYHYILKTHWLHEKCNCQIDHIILTFVNGLAPYYEARHKWQSIGIKGTNLVEWQWQEILASIRSISWDSIQQFDDIEFHIASTSRLKDYYVIDLA